MKWLVAVGIPAVLAGLSVLLLARHYRAAPMERTEIYHGVYLRVEQLPDTPEGSGRLMVVEVHWDTPGVELRNRNYSYAVNPLNPHYRLANADWSLWKEGASVLVNTTTYHPSEFYKAIPGLPVRSGETVVVEGVPSHVHEHSYLMYWDRDMNAHMLRHKPPDPQSLKDAVLGIGVQGVPISEGQTRFQAMGYVDEVMPRTFIGFDPTRNILYLLAFEKASGRLMLHKALEAGVVFGAMMDCGGSTSLLIGRDANGVPAHTGIRGWRPLGSYLMVNADPL